MSDIVERLRKENSMPPYYGVPKIQADAADEITRLRARVRELEGQHKGLVIANAVLRQRPDLPVDRIPVADDVLRLRAQNAELVEALRWYEARVKDCRKTTSEGDVARSALDADAGSRARAALAKVEKETSDE